MIERHHTGKTVPGFDQAASGPIGRQVRELLLIGKGLNATPRSHFG